MRITAHWLYAGKVLAGVLYRFGRLVRCRVGRRSSGPPYFIPAAEIGQRNDLLCTLEAKPPIINGQVQVVEIVGFDVQACGGTHVHSPGDVGNFAIVRTENNGKINKRLYIHLAPTASPHCQIATGQPSHQPA